MDQVYKYTYPSLELNPPKRLSGQLCFQCLYAAAWTRSIRRVETNAHVDNAPVHHPAAYCHATHIDITNMDPIVELPMVDDRCDTTNCPRKRHRCAIDLEGCSVVREPSRKRTRTRQDAVSVDGHDIQLDALAHGDREEDRAGLIIESGTTVDDYRTAYKEVVQRIQRDSHHCRTALRCCAIDDNESSSFERTYDETIPPTLRCGTGRHWDEGDDSVGSEADIEDTAENEEEGTEEGGDSTAWEGSSEYEESSISDDDDSELGNATDWKVSFKPQVGEGDAGAGDTTREKERAKEVEDDETEGQAEDMEGKALIGKDDTEHKGGDVGYTHAHGDTGDEDEDEDGDNYLWTSSDDTDEGSDLSDFIDVVSEYQGGSDYVASSEVSEAGDSYIDNFFSTYRDRCTPPVDAIHNGEAMHSPGEYSA